MSKKAYNDPADISAEDGEVVMLGPGTMHGSMTPEAAAETGRRLTDVAAEVERTPKPPAPSSE